MSAGNVADVYPLTPSQRGMMFHTVAQPDGAMYFEQITCRVEGSVERDTFERAWCFVVTRHDVLRASVQWALDRPQLVVRRQVTVPMVWLDWRGKGATESLEAWLADDRRRGFELQRAPLWRAAMIAVGSSTHQFVLSFHHTILDGWSLSIVIAEVLAAYESLCAGREPQLPPAPRFRDFIAWLNARDRADAELYWRRTLQEFAGTRLPILQASQWISSEAPACMHRQIPVEIASRVQSRARALAVTPATLFQGAWAVLLARYGGESRVVFGSMAAGRSAEVYGIDTMVGVFISTLPVTVIVDDEARVADWLRDLNLQLAELREHEHTPPQVIRGSMGPVARLFDTLFIVENYPLRAALNRACAGLTFRDIQTFEKTNYPLTISLLPGPPLVIELQWDRVACDAAAVDRLIEGYMAVLDQLTLMQAQRVRELRVASRLPSDSLRIEPRLSVAEEQVLLIHRRVVMHAQQDPEATAIICGGRKTSYRELVCRAGRVAAALRALGVASGEAVCVVLELSMEAAAVVLGMLEAGATVVAVSGAETTGRVAAGCRFILSARADAHSDHATHVCFEQLLVETAARSSVPQVHVDQLACVFIDPRGEGPLAIAHRDLTKSLMQVSLRIGLARSRTFAVSAVRCPLVGMLLPLTSGACAVLTPGSKADVEEYTAIQLACLTQKASNSSILVQVGADAGTRLACDTALAEWVSYAPAGSIAGWVGRFAVGTNGRPLLNGTCGEAFFRVLDDAFECTGCDIAGDLYIAGPLAQGYWNDPARTAGHFIPDPDGGPGARLYHTGDRARRLENGAIEYLGPREAHLSLKGRSLDLGDVQQAFAALECVHKLPVVSVSRDAATLPELSIWLVADAQEHEAIAQTLRRALDDFPVPARWRYIDMVPLTAAGAVAFNALPPIETGEQRKADRFVEPRAGAEATLAQIWAQVLGVRHVSVTDDFYDLGGDSIASIQIVVQARRAGLALSVQQVMELPTVLQQARVSARTECGEPAAPPVLSGRTGSSDACGECDAEVYPLTPLQAGMLFHSLLAPQSGMYVQQMGCRIEGPLDAEAFGQAWRVLTVRHAILRTSFRLARHDDYVQYVHPSSEVVITVQWLNWETLSSRERSARLTTLLAEQRRAGFPADAPPLFAVTVARIGPSQHELIVSFHHALLDGWSTSALLDELLTVYASCRSGLEPGLPPAVSLHPYFDWLARRDLSDDETFWHQYLRGLFTPTPVPGVAKHPAAMEKQQSDRQVPGRLSKSLDAVRTAELHALARHTRTTISTVLHAAWALMLARYSDCEDVCFGITVAGRPAGVPGVERMIGLFINTLPLRIHVPSAAPLSSWLQEVAVTMRELRRFEHSALSDIQRWSELPAGRAVFETIFVVENYPAARSFREGNAPLQFGPAWVEGKVNYPLALVALPGPTLRVEFLYDRTVVSPEHVEQLLDQFLSLLGSFARAPQELIRDFGLLSPEVYETLIHGWNHTTRRWPESERGLHELFERQAVRVPEQIALIEGSRSITYSELNQRAGTLARHISAAGVGVEARIGIYLERSIEMIAALIAVLKSGGAYVPLEPHSPRERIDFMVRDADVRLIVTTSVLANHLPDRTQRLLLHSLDIAPVKQAVSSAVQSASRLAYVLYTSGTTGRPKGVAISHGAATNHMLWFNDQWPLERERTLLKTPIAFDAAGWEVWAPLLSGGTIVVAPPDAHRHPEELLAVVRAHAVSVMQVVPSLLEGLIESQALADCPTLRRVFCGGEPLQGSLWRRLTDWPEIELINLYGPTETTIDTTYYACIGEPLDEVPVGRPIANVRLYVLDSNMLPLPVGATGELYIGGAGVGRGYIARPELTAERFVPDPFGDHGARLYRSGDQVRWNADGSLCYVGRIDRQVKIRGHRIELGEVEAVIRALLQIHDVAVVTEGEEQGSRQLVAFAVSHLAPSSDEELRAALAPVLPEVMIPSRWVWLDALPLTASGKVDRRALRAPPPTPQVAAPGEPSNDVERRLRDVFCEVLALVSCGIHESFFALGGDSILSLKLVARCRRKGLVLQHRDVFAHPTIAALAALINASARPTPADSPPPETSVPQIAGMSGELIEDAFEITSLQHGMLFHSMYAPDANFYVQHIECTVEGMLEPDLLIDSLGVLVRRHPILRTSFHLDARPRPLQAVWRDAAMECVQVDFSEVSPEVRDDAVSAFVEKDGTRPFDLSRPPLLRLLVVRRSGADWRLVLSFHHALLDGWSLGLLLQELFTIYDARKRGAHYASHPALSMREFVKAKQAGREEAARQLAARVSGAPGPPYLPICEPSAASEEAGCEQRVVRQLLAKVSGQILALTRDTGVTVASVAHAAWGVLLSRYSGGNDVVFGSVFADRPAKLEDSLGLYLNTLPLRLRVRGDMVSREWLAAVQRELVALRSFEQAGLDDVQRLASEDSRSAPLFDTLMVVENLPRVEVDWRSVGLRVVEVEARGRTHYALTILVIPGAVLTLEAHFPRGAFSEVRIETLLAHFSNLMAAMAAQPDVSLDELRMLDAEERDQFLRAAYGGQSPGIAGETLHGLVERQRVARGSRIAVVAGSRQLTLDSLDEQAGLLAAELRRRGVHAETPVAVQIPRSPELIVALLGVLKAGGAYVPIDSESASAHTRALMERVNARISIRIQHNADASGFEITGSVASGECASGGDALNAECAAYILFTSGSTGTPKAVVNSHRAIVNRLLWMRDALEFDDSDSILQKTPHTFDVSLWDTFLPLVIGARLVLAPAGVRIDPAELNALICAQKITALHFVPSLLAEFLDHAAPAACQSLRLVVCSGEALAPALVERVFAVLPHVELYNLYGPTETAVDVTMWRCRPGHSRVPIGYPITGTYVHVLSPSGEPSPIGGIGGIHVGGVAVGRGYLGLPELTSARFVPDGCSGVSGGRLYDTGDRGQRRDDGAIDFCGRSDRQLKLYGVRVEPDGIESVLAAHSAVRRVAVTLQTVAGKAQLLAWVEVAAQAERATLEAELQAHLEEQQPLARVACRVICVGRLPTMRSGKVDMTRLPQVPQRRTRAAVPETPTERALAPLWAEVLGVSGEVDVLGNFFDLGGESLAAARLVAHVASALSVRVLIRELFAAPTLRAFAARIDTAMRRLPEADPVFERSDPVDVPLSHAQERLWFLEQLHPGSHEYHVPLGARLSGPLDTGAVQRALRMIGERHEVLRTRFGQRAGKPFAQVDARSAIECELRDLSELPLQLRDSQLRATASTYAQRPFDLASGHAWRVLLIRLAQDEHALILTLHHAVCDYVSLPILLREFALAYEAALTHNSEPGLPRLDVQYGQFARWQRKHLQGERLEALLSFWRQTLAAPLPVVSLPGHLQVPAAETGSGTCTIELAAEASARVRQVAQAHGCTPYLWWLAVWKTVLSRYANQFDIVVGSPVSNRPLAAFEPLIGLFVNTLVLRSDLSGNPTFASVLERVREVALRAWEHQDLPFELLVRELRPERDLHSTPLFQVFFDLLGPEALPAIRGVRVEPVDVEYGVARFELSLFVKDTGESFKLFLEYSRGRFESLLMEQLLSSVLTLVQAVCDRPTTPILQLPVVSGSERGRSMSAGPVVDLGTAFAHEHIWMQAARLPDTIAVSQRDAPSMTYRDLCTRGADIARHLLTEGMQPEEPVGVLMARNATLVAAMLGVLQAGGAYVPVDPNLPLRRRRFILEQAKVRIVLCDTPRCVEDLGTNILRVDAERLDSQDDGPDLLPIRILPRQLAYILFTSGSTGSPKGAMVEHAALANHLFARKVPQLQLGAQDVLAQTASQSFDISVWQLLTAPASGGRVHIICDRIVRDPFLLLEEFETAGITVAEIVPSLMRALLGALEVLGPKRPALLRLRHLVLGGEALTSAMCEAWSRWYPHTRLTNGYGPTECADDVATHTFDPPIDTAMPAVPIGRAIPNVRVYLLDDGLEPVPPGIAGELYVAGNGVGRGYANDPARTAEVFLPDLASDAPGARMYRTGDIARQMPSGAFVFVGRVDHQVKLRGFRIELPEIEAVLQRHAAVSQALADVREPTPGRSELVAWILRRAGEQIGRDELRSFASTWLPHYMVPSNWIFLDEMPLNSNGKVDRRALPYPAPAADDLGPASTDESVLAVLALMRDLLGRSVGAHEDFFRAGGDSLLAVELAHRLANRSAVHIPLVAIFEHSSAAKLARWIELRGEAPTQAAAEAVDATAENVAPTTIAQLGTWLVHQRWPTPQALNLWFAVRISGALDLGILRQVFAILLKRHDALRAGFALVDDVPSMVFGTEDLRIELTLTNLVAASRSDEMLCHEIAAEIQRPFDLRRPPLIRALIVRSAPQEHALCVVAHHIIMDGWSVRILTGEALQLYAALAAGKAADPLPPVRAGFREFARRERLNLTSGRWEEEASWWFEKLHGVCPPTPLIEGAALSQDIRTALLRRKIDAEAAGHLNRLARDEGCTPFVALLSVLSMALQRRFGSDVRVATPVANREDPATATAVGLMMNTVVLRLDVNADCTFQQLLQHARAVVRDALNHQAYPFDLLGRRLESERGIELPSLARVWFAFDHESAAPIRPIDLTFQEITEALPHLRSTESLPLGYDIALFADAAGISWTAEYRCDRVSKEFVAALLDDIDHLACQLAQRSVL